MTKDELIKKVEVLESRVESLQDSDKKIREELSKILGAPTYTERYCSAEKIEVYSWLQIVCQIGMLLQVKDAMHVVRDLKFTEERIGNLEDELKHFISNPNKND